MKKAMVLLLNDYAYWESSYCSSILNKISLWDIKQFQFTNMLLRLVDSPKIDILINDVNDCDALIMIG
ncbi:hypothetical protein NGA95_09905 [Staphylococcus epidermidis]|uniref:hypothetical protein n=1 Tax=Staphylococcus epidermidis TaxID=1282 RepID=UPI002480CBC9|nr:hypothetical protein [Staphylococcus epidermidis]MCG2312908.1 hypothetical protein [Staphylococcus epidermidis]MDH9183890.1 hypothetical protein [Staphylococcus epidermidis]MEB7744821.1 hypothetical protein [Staphylococcus epidermidis]